MKPWLLSLALLALPAAAMTKIADTNGMAIYLVESERKADIVSAWVLIDYAELGPAGERSSRMLTEIRCQEKRVRIPTMYGYSQSRGAGAPIGRSDPLEWADIAPQTIPDLVRRHVCR